MNVYNEARLPAEEVAALAASLNSATSLERVLAWGRQQPPGTMHPRIVADVVTQDEFTHDIVVPWQRGLVLVFDAT